MPRVFNEELVVKGGLQLPGGVAGQFAASDAQGNVQWQDGVVSDITRPASAPNRSLAWNGFKNQWVDDVGIYSPRNDRGVVIQNAVVDPRATTSANFAGTASGAGTIGQAPTPQADGYQQAATPMSCQEVKATPDAAGGGYVGFATRWKANGNPVASTFGVPMVAVRRACKISGVLGGAWYAALVVKYYDAADTDVQEVVVWSDQPALDAWFVAEGFDGQAPASATYIETELRVYGSTPGNQVTMRCTEFVAVKDPDGDVPTYIGGDLPLGYWNGTADASTSQATIDPLVTYTDDKPFGFDTATWSTVADQGQVRALGREIGADTLRCGLGFLTGGGVGPPIVAPTPDPSDVAAIEEHIKQGFKIVLGCPNPPAWMTSTNDASGVTIPDLYLTTYAGTVVTAIQSIEAATGIPAAEWLAAVEVWNEPNLVQFNKWIATLTNAAAAQKYVDMLNAVYTAVKASYPSTPVLGGVLSNNVSANVAASVIAPVEFYNDMIADGAQFDYLALHPYPGGPSSGPAAAGWTPINSGLTTGWDAGLKQMKDAMRAASDSRQIWVTECGQIAYMPAGTYPTGGYQAERAQQQAVCLLYGRMRRDASIVGISLFSGFAHVQSTTKNDYGFVDATSHRRRGVAHQLASMRGMPQRPLSYSEVLRVKSAWEGSAVSAPGSMSANTGTANQVLIGLGAAAIVLGGNTNVPGNAPSVNLVRTITGAGGAYLAINQATDVAGMIRTSGIGTNPTSGAGVETFYSANTGSIQVYDRSAAVYRNLILRGGDSTVAANVSGLYLLAQSGSVWIQPPTANPSNPALILKGAASQTGDLIQLQNSSGAQLLNITSTGKITQYEYAFSAWKAVPMGSYITTMAAADLGASLYMPYYGGKVQSGATNSGFAAFYLDPADFGAGSRTVKLRVKATVITNSVAPGCTITVGLSSVNGFGGASGANPTVNIGGSLSSGAVVTPAANTGSVITSTVITFPAAGFYVFAITLSQALAAGATLQINPTLEYQQV